MVTRKFTTPIELPADAANAMEAVPKQQLDTEIAGRAASAHSHAAADTTSGTFAIGRIPTGTSSSTVCIGNDSRLSDARTPTAHKTSHATGGGDALTPSDIGAQPSDQDLTDIAALSPSNNDVMQRKSGAWINRTIAQFKADLGYTAADVGAQASDADLTSIAALDSSTAGALVTDGSGWIRKTYAQLKTALSLVKADVGLGNVTNDAQVPLATVDAKGDLLVGTADNTVARKAVGANDRLLIADSSQSDGLRWATPAEVRAALSLAAQTQSVTTTLSIDASTGDHHQITATGNPAFGVPSNGTNTQMLLVEILASGAQRTVTLNGSIILTSGLSATLVIPSGKVGVIGLRYSTLASGWILLAATVTL